MTSKTEEYQRYARQCVEIAPTFQDEERRAILLDQAQAWLRLAHLAQANRQIAQLARQRVIVKHALDTGQRSEMAESLLEALEGSLRIFEKHRMFLLSCNGSSSALPPGDAATGRGISAVARLVPPNLKNDRRSVTVAKLSAAAHNSISAANFMRGAGLCPSLVIAFPVQLHDNAS